MKKEVIKNILSWGMYIAFGLLLALFMVTFVFRFTVVKGDSMRETLKNNQVLYTDKLTYRFKSPKRGDIVICRYPGFEENCIKRVIGLPGETIYIKDGVVYINDSAGEDLWKGNHEMEDMSSVIIPEDCYFVMGDNRSNSRDSRDKTVGCIPMKDIYGKATFSVLPLNKIAAVEQ